MTERLVAGLREVDETQVALVGGKGAHLGVLSRLDGVDVPDGFCVTTDAFRRVVAQEPPVAERLDLLARLGPAAPEAGPLGAELRRTIEAVDLPDDLEAAVRGALAGWGDGAPCAVRSSATAEDLPTASFAGQQESFLGVVGPAAVLDDLRRCWASLFTDRAVAYRSQRGIDHRTVAMAVLVQRMVVAEASGVLFTADPVTGDRTVCAVEAVRGLGEPLVCGRVAGDVYRVRGGEVVARSAGGQQVALRASPAGGTQEQALDPALQARPVLTDPEVLRLAELGRRVEACFGSPQDIEWCLAGDGFHVVQSRPVTTLFPVPANPDGGNHVYVSVGHQQMMTDPMKPLGLSFWQLTTPAPMAVAGGRLFVDVTQRLATPSSRDGLLEALERSDPLIGDALRTLLARDGFVRPLPDEGTPGPLFGTPVEGVETDPAVVTGLIASAQASIAAAERQIRALSGEALVTFVEDDLQELRRVLFDPVSHQVFLSAMQAAWWLNDHLEQWLGERNVADTVTQSVPHSVTSEMGLALLDVADVVRPHADVVAALERVDGEDFLDALVGLPGGRESRDALAAWLERYGMRCPGEIDLTRPRWSERPSMVVPLVLGNVRSFAPGEAARRFEQGRQEASAKEQEVLERLRALPDGEARADETKRMIDRVRTFIGYREYPKYGMVSRYFVYKRALLGEAGRLVAAGVLREPEDVFYLSLAELAEVVRTRRADASLVDRRREEFRSFELLTPPRVLTSDGEVVTGTYRRDDLPAGALAGLAVSAGVVEGRARVVLDLALADLEPGDVLVTAYTDPSWTPLFVAVAGLVTEVGGLMTHGAVVAREYGLPAVVGVEGATRLIRDGQRVRVHGTEGYVEILP